MDDRNNSLKAGVVVSVRGSVVDCRFDGHLPPIYSILRAGENSQVIIEVMAQLVAIYGGCAILAMSLYGGDLLAGMASLVPPGLLANPWLLTLLACAGASRLLSGRRRPGADAQRPS